MAENNTSKEQILTIVGGAVTAAAIKPLNITGKPKVEAAAETGAGSEPHTVDDGFLEKQIAENAKLEARAASGSLGKTVLEQAVRHGAKAAGIIGAGVAAFEIGKDLSAGDYKAAVVDTAATGGGFGGWGVGAAVGSVFGPEGTIIGGVVGAAVGEEGMRKLVSIDPKELPYGGDEIGAGLGALYMGAPVDTPKTIETPKPVDAPATAASVQTIASDISPGKIAAGLGAAMPIVGTAVLDVTLAKDAVQYFAGSETADVVSHALVSAQANAGQVSSLKVNEDAASFHDRFSDLSQGAAAKSDKAVLASATPATPILDNVSNKTLIGAPILAAHSFTTNTAPAVQIAKAEPAPLPRVASKPSHRASISHSVKNVEAHQVPPLAPIDSHAEMAASSAKTDLPGEAGTKAENQFTPEVNGEAEKKFGIKTGDKSQYAENTRQSLNRFLNMGPSMG